jgi:hypothetical protein
MKFLLLLFATLVINDTRVSAQITFPKGFKQIKGERGSGLDDVYFNGRYAFSTSNEFNAYDHFDPTNDSVRNYLRSEYGVSFHLTRDSLLWGTGKFEGAFKYIIVDQGGQEFILQSYYNDEGFSSYSIWLITSLREYRKDGKAFMFPMQE